MGQMSDWGFNHQTNSVSNSSQTWVNKRLLILVVCALMVVFGGYLCASYFGSAPEPEVAAVASSKAAGEVQTDAAQTGDTAKKASSVNAKESVTSMRSDLFSGPMALRGIIMDSRNSVALIEAGDMSYVASRGMPVEEQWVVKEIKPDEVVLESQNEKLRLRFHGRAEIETLAGNEKGDRD